MTTCLIAFFLSFVLSLFATREVMVLAIHWGVVDRPDNYRKVHHREVPRTGGIGIYLAFFFPLAALYLAARFSVYENLVSGNLLNLPTELKGLFIGATVVFAMGLVDDVRSLTARWKLLFQTVGAVIAYFHGCRINEVDLPFAGTFELGLASFPLTIFWFLGCMNALNLLDGLDGLAAGVCLLVAATMLIVSLIFNNVVSMVLAASLGGAILGFLFYNFYPAKIFLGDSGSMFLGFAIGYLSILGSRTAETAVSMFVPVIALGLPILDTSLAIARRWAQKLPLSAPDRQHLHHALMSMGLSHRRTVLVLYAICIVFGVSALLVSIESSELIALVLGSLGIIIFVCVRVLGGLRFEALVEKFSGDYRRNQEDGRARVVLERASHWLEGAGSTEELWKLCLPVFESLALDHASLLVGAADGKRNDDVFEWQRQGSPDISEMLSSVEDCMSARMTVRAPGGARLATLEVRKRIDDEEAWISAAPELLGRLTTILGAQLARVAPPGAALSALPGDVSPVSRR